MAWKNRYPEYPDLTNEGLRDFRERLDRLQNPSPEVLETDEGGAQYVDDCRHYWASLLRLFVASIDAGEPVAEGVLLELRRAFFDVLGGKVWEDAIPLPGREFKEEWYAYSSRERRDMALCDKVRTRVKFGAKVTDAMMQVALDTNHSYETVRAAHYAWKQWHADIEAGCKKSAEELEGPSG